MSRMSLKDCHSPWDWLAIDSAGLARCCCHSRGLIGNLNETPFDEVWNGDGMLKLRHAVSEDRFVQYCKGAACQFALNKQASIDREGSPLPAGGRIDFSDNGNSLDYTIGGWSTPHGDSTWTLGPRSSLKISILPVRLRTMFRVSATAYLGGLHTADVTFSLNGRPIGPAMFADVTPRTLKFPIPFLFARRHRGSPIEITLQIARPISPQALGVSDDDRALGIAVHWIEVG